MTNEAVTEPTNDVTEETKAAKKKGKATDVAIEPYKPIMGEYAIDTKNGPQTPRVPFSKLVVPDFDSRAGETELESEFVASIKDRGILVPLLVAPIAGTDKFLIGAGRRRSRAGKEVKLKDAPICVIDMPVNTPEEIDDFLVTVAMIENEQRKNLSAWDRAESYRRLKERGWTQEKIAKACSRTPGYVAQHLGLYDLDPRVLTIIRKNINSEGMFSKARELKRLKDGETQLAVAKDAFDPTKAWTSQDIKDTVEKIRAQEEVKAAKAAEREKAKKKSARKAGAEGAEGEETEEEEESPFSAVKFEIGVKDLRKLMDAVNTKITALKARDSVKPETIAYQKGILDGLKMATGIEELPKSVAETE